MEYVHIGRIVKTFGIKGELKVYPYTDFIEERFKGGSQVYLGEEHLPMTVKAFHRHKDFLLVLFEDHEDINLVEKFKNLDIYKAREDIKPLPEGQYYFSDLKDLDVYVDDEKVGKVIQVESGVRANNLRILSYHDKREHLVPFLPVFIKNVDLKKERIDIVGLEGLL